MGGTSSSGYCMPSVPVQRSSAVVSPGVCPPGSIFEEFLAVSAGAPRSCSKGAC